MGSTHQVVIQWAFIELVFLVHQQKYTYLNALQLKREIQLETMDLDLQRAKACSREKIWLQKCDLASWWMQDANGISKRLNWVFNEHRVLNPLALELHTLMPSCCPQLMLPELSDSQSVAGIWEIILEGILWLGWAAACCRTWLWFSLIRIQIWKPFKEKSVWIVMFFLASHSLLFHLYVCCCFSTNQSKTLFIIKVILHH